MATPLNTAAPPGYPTTQPGGAVHNTAITATIADALATGLHHPGNAPTGQPAHAIELPMFRTAGMPPQMAQLVKQSTLEIAQAIVALIETTHTITPKQT